MFTDISGYTAQTSKQSRVENQKLLDSHNKILLPLVKRFGGRHIKSIGDALLCVFASPTDALLCAMAMQDSLFDDGLKKSPENRIHIKIGINVGDVRLEPNDVFGEAVNLASRIQSVTPSDEIYFSDGAYLAMNKAEIPSEEVGLKEFKGVTGEVRIWQVSFFSSTRPDPDTDNSLKDIARISYPFGGAHLRLPPKKSIIQNIIGDKDKAPMLFLFLFITCVIAGLAIFSHSSKSTVSNSSPLQAEDRISQVQKLYDELKFSGASCSKGSQLAREELETLRKRVSDGEMKASDLTWQNIAVEERSLLPKDIQIILSSEFEKKVQDSLRRAREAKMAGDELTESQILDSIDNEIRLAQENIEFLKSSTEVLIDVRMKMSQWEQIEGIKSKDLPSLALGQSLVREARNEKLKKNYGLQLKYLQKAKECFDVSIQIETGVQEVLKSATKNSQNESTLGMEALVSGDYDESIIHYNASLRLGEEAPSTFYGLSQAYEGRGLTDEALLVLGSHYSKFFPVKAYTAMGQILYRRGNYPEALQYLESAFKLLKPEDLHLEVTYTLAQTYKYLGNNKKALELYDASLKLLKENSAETVNQPMNIRDTIEANIQELNAKMTAQK